MVWLYGLQYGLTFQSTIFVQWAYICPVARVVCNDSSGKNFNLNFL